MARQRYSPEVKQAAIAALIEGESPALVAVRYNIAFGTVRAWKSRLIAEGAISQLDEIMRAEVRELILAYLREGLVSLREQAQAFRERDWLRRQNANDAAILHGVLVDKAVRILEALDRHTKAGAPDGDHGVQ